MQPTPATDHPDNDIPRSHACPDSADGLCQFGLFEPMIDRSGLLPGAGVRRCRSCGMGISVPPLADVAFLYTDRSSQDFQPNTSRLAGWIKTIAFRSQARQILARLGVAPHRIVDFGCGSGLFTRCLGDVANAAEVVGVDFHAVPPPALSERPYRCIAHAADLTGTADAVIAMHVLEHDDDTGALLRRVVRLARPGGVVMLEVPNIDCCWAPVFGRFWDAWYVPYHRVHFTKSSLRLAVEREGLTVLSEGSASVPTIGRTFANLLGRPNTLAFILVSALLQPVQRLGEVLTGRPSALQIVARVPT